MNHLNAYVRAKLNDIMINYESIFSWNIIQLTGKNNNLMMEHIDVVKEKIENISDNRDEFNESRYYLVISITYLINTYYCACRVVKISFLVSIDKCFHRSTKLDFKKCFEGASTPIFKS